MLLNAAAITKLNAPPLIVTLGTFSLFRGIAEGLIVEQLLSAHNKKLSGVYVIPDASFNFNEIDLR